MMDMKIKDNVNAAFMNNETELLCTGLVVAAASGPGTWGCGSGCGWGSGWGSGWGYGLSGFGWGGYSYPYYSFYGKRNGNLNYFRGVFKVTYHVQTDRQTKCKTNSLNDT